jgi:hypothetical protein
MIDCGALLLPGMCMAVRSLCRFCVASWVGLAVVTRPVSCGRDAQGVLDRCEESSCWWDEAAFVLEVVAEQFFESPYARVDGVGEIDPDGSAFVHGYVGEVVGHFVARSSHVQDLVR